MKSMTTNFLRLIATVVRRPHPSRSIPLVSAALLGLATGQSHAAVLLSENFNAGSGGFTVTTPVAYDGPWVYSAGTGSWVQDGQGPENSHANTSTLISPAISVPQTGVMVLSFTHRYSFEQGNWDGGQVRISVNGGAFTAVPAAAFTQAGYNGAVLGNSLSLLAGQPAFVLDSPSFASSKLNSICTLGSFQAGDSIRVAFMAANDSNTRGNFQPNWEIDSVEVSTPGAIVMNCSTNIIAECAGTTTPVTFVVTASDENGPLPVTCVPPSGSGFRQGTTNVVCTASNATGTNTCTFTVTVVDTTPPTVTCPSNITATATSPSGAVVTYIASAFDPCGIGSLTATPPSGSIFPVGTNTVPSQ